MISYLIDMMPPQVDTVIIAANYRKNQIEQYFKEHDCGKKIIINDEPKPLGTAGATKFAEHHITGSFFVLNSDIICSLDLAEMMAFHKKKQAVTSISLWPVENVSEFGVVDIKDNGNVVGFVEKPKSEDAPSDLINAGAYLLEPEILDYIETGRLVSMEKEIFPQIIKDTRKFYGYRFEGFWIDVGRITSFLDVHQMLLRQKGITQFLGENCVIQGDIEHSSIGNDVVVGDACVQHSVVLNNAHIGNGVQLNNCVIGENCTIEDNAVLTHVAVGDNEIIPANTTVENQVIWTQPEPEGYPKKQIGNVIGE
jgi:mannose-1-phosphate guanylyltransferase